MKAWVMAGAVAFALVATVSGADARGRVRAGAPFRPEVFFAGRTHSEGAFVDAQGKPESRFAGDTVGHRETDGSTTFRQMIRFDDGTTRDRTWHIVPVDAGRITATASDMVGTAEGRIDGRVLHLTYTVRTDDKNPLLDVDFDQTMTLEPGGRTVLNESTITKLGIVVRRASERFVRSGRR